MTRACFLCHRPLGAGEGREFSLSPEAADLFRERGGDKGLEAARQELASSPLCSRCEALPPDERRKATRREVLRLLDEMTRDAIARIVAKN